MLTKALVLAAGMGSRLREISGDLPKPLTPFAGAPILAHTLRWLAGSGVGEVFINLHYQQAMIRETIGDGAAYGLTVHYVYEPELLGTAGALANIASEVDQPMLVVYGDNLMRFDLAALGRAHARSPGAVATIALFDVDAHLHTGIAGGRVSLEPDGRITGFVEGGGGASSLVNAGVYVVEPSLLDLIPPCRLVDFGRDVFPAALELGLRLQGRVIESTGFCLGLDTPQAWRRGLDLVHGGQLRLAP